ncbi:MAG: symmetrical bis(5'-nucleosyl)-tetraphosphatase [Myxococcales bacterium]|nr:symmetrical bis(5'-nucleosyl)-tetraphosphatase [Myxococcales bacterium]MCB9523768.1 symmetrical bis(5'-nucleosyl)-tetraphosphatase [Myxococcales bacterium]
MSRTWVIGDVQGCAASLQALVQALAFDPARDRLWFVGDLVNRGPDNLSVLRFVRGLGDAAVCVLGNHDLHLLARAGQGRKAGKWDTLQDVLGAPDRDALVDWVRHWPLLHVEGDHVLVHGGLNPRWTLDEAQARARVAEAKLRGPDWGEAARPGDGDPAQRKTLAGLCLLRAVDAKGALNLGYKGPLAGLPAGHRPWFEASLVARPPRTVWFGHWAALGYLRGPGWCAVDTGCVWGRTLTAVCIEDGQRVQVPRHPADAVAFA